MKNILIIGGSYFTGRVFAMIANGKGHKLSFINRGTFSMSHMEGTKEYKCDRHDTEGLKQYPYEEFDAVVDFCAYEPGDCRNLLENLNIKTSKYVLLSTADVYDREIRTAKDEEEITYDVFMQILKEVSDIPFETTPVTVSQVFEQNLPLPFPLTEDESELFIAQKSKDLLGMHYTPLRTGLEKAYIAFKNVYGE